MKIFKYLSSGRGIAETYEIYKVVQNLKPYAVVKYKGNWEDALEESFFHVLENYNPSRGELEHYATKVVGTIYLSLNNKELVNTEQTDICMDLQTAKSYSHPGVEEVDVLTTDFKMCLSDMVNLLLKDFKFFASSCTKDRKGDYSELFKKYSVKTIDEAMTYLLNTYKDDAVRLTSFSRKISIKDFKEDRYSKSIDKGIIYCGCINDIVVIKRAHGYHTKKIYKLDIEAVVGDIVRLFYSDLTYGKAVIEGIPVYASLSGKIAYSVDELKSFLERELVGSILSRTPLKVVHYNRGSDMLLSSTKDTQNDVQLPMFGKDFVINFDRVAVKEVS